MRKRTLQIYLPPSVLKKTERTAHKFYNTVIDAFEKIGFVVSLHENTAANMLISLAAEDLVLYHRNRPQDENTLEARPAYIEPFWSIDSTSIHSQKRVYKALFDPTQVGQKRAQGFFDNWSKRVVGQEPVEYHERNYALVALQGILLRQRSWQSMAPIDMLQKLIEADRERRILIKFHPGESYSKDEVAAVKALTNDRVEIVNSDLNQLLSSCAYTVSMNSSVSFKGLFFKKPGVLFGDMDCHHIFQSVSSTRSVDQCVNNVLQDKVPFEKYIFWFLYKQMVNANRDWSDELILARCADLGWDLGDYKPTDSKL